ncbi:MAG: transcriptional regulator, TetR family [Proteobacteria bacterium]|nr:transcriptional regulator, TetR family [Pseudomonadota bacterium]
MTPADTNRDRSKTEQKLVEAVGRVLARDGFERCGVNAVAREAKVDKVLIYRYFAGMPGLLKTYGESSNFWPTQAEILGEERQVLRLPQGERLEAIVMAILEALRKRPQTLTIMAWELVQRNPLTESLAQVRESWSRELTQEASLHPGASPEQAEDAVALANLVVAGLQYLLLRARTVSEYGGLSLQDDAGWQRIRRAIRLLGQGLENVMPEDTA